MSFHYVRDTTRPTPYPTGSDPMNLKARMLEGNALWTDTDVQGHCLGPTHRADPPKFTLTGDLSEPSNPSDRKMLG